MKKKGKKYRDKDTKPKKKRYEEEEEDDDDEDEEEEERFNPPDIRHVADADWEEYEDVYIAAINAIEVPPDLTPRGILQVNAEIDAVYGPARFAYAFAKTKLARYEQRLSNAKKTARIGFVKQAGQTNEDREALITTYLEVSPLKGDTEPLFVLVERWTERFNFMDSVIDNLLKKSDKMINGNGALKLDAQGRGDMGK